jgi:predicted nucleic acid-binding protein
VLDYSGRFESAREIAKREGLDVIGTVGLLLVLLKSGLITETAETLFEKLNTYGFRMRKAVFLAILRNKNRSDREGGA